MIAGLDRSANKGPAEPGLSATRTDPKRAEDYLPTACAVSRDADQQ